MVKRFCRHRLKSNNGLLLLTLSVLLWVYFTHRALVVKRAATVEETHPFVDPTFSSVQLSVDELAVLRRTFVTLVDALSRSNAKYFMTGRTLLGSYRHHGMIPWDDGIALIIGKGDKARVIDALRALAPDYVTHNTLHGQRCYTLKFYKANGTVRVQNDPWRFPFVDVMFFDEDNDTVWNDCSWWFPEERWPKTAVFPLMRRPFNGLWLPAPCDTYEVLDVNFRINECVVFSNRRQSVPIVSVPCRNLTRKFPFVDRYRALGTHGNNAEEFLMIGGEMIARTKVHSCCC